LGGVAAAGALIISPLAVAGQANAVDPGNGVISVKLVDDLGQPVTGSVQLFPAGDDDPITLGLPAIAGPPVAASSFVEEIPAGTYGALVLGGWAGMTCVGLSSCSPALLSAPSLGAGAFTVPEGLTTPLTITIATPKLTGTPEVGLPLTVAVPSSLKELSALMAGLGGGGLGLPSDPAIAWNRNGSPLGAAGTTYTPTTADAGSTISATVTFPAIVGLLLGQMGGGIVPPPFTTSAVTINKLTPSIKLSVPGKVKQGKRPTAYVNVKVGSTPVGGVVTFVVDKLRPQQGVLRSGLATFKLPKLKPGKHKVTASFAAAGAYNAAKVTKTVVVKGKKGIKPMKQ
jgi:hypothetical protein